jgi:malonate-semialdehyde dehydrogenase (acetylating)/methylmalonate-semialdehyde dehydrogenase
MTEKFENVRLKNFLHGEWVEATGVETVPLFNPSTGQQIGEVPLSSQEISAEAIDSASSAYDSWRKTPLSKRMTCLYDLRQALIDHEEDLAVTIAVDQAKHVSEARGEIRRIIEIFESACTIPSLIQGDTLNHIAPNINGRVIKEPIGVIGGVAPFNFPALVFGWFIPYAIGTGNTFIFKPSPQSPMFMQKMGSIFQDIGLPKGVINIINGEVEVPMAWYEDARVRGVCSVGSTPTAKKIAESCARTAKRSMLLGGAKNILVAMEDVEPENFLQNFIHSCYGSAGQRCLAGSVVAMVPEVYDTLLERMIEAAKNIKTGDAMDPDVYMGPVISKQAKERIEKYIELGLQEHCELVLDGRNPELSDKNKDGFFVGPTILTGVTTEKRVFQDEIFGPVVSVMKINNLDEVLDIIRSQPYGNGACIFTQNQHYTEQFIEDANVGMVGVNVGVCAPHPYLPFGGIKDSLLGTNKVQGKEGIDFFTQNKIATVRTTPPTGKFITDKDREDEPDKGASSVRSCVAS